MAVNMSGKLNLDGTSFNQSMQSAVQETAKLKREVDSANKTMNTFQKGLGSATSSISSMMNSFKAGDIGGFITGARGAATAITSMIPAAGGATAAVTGLGTAIYTALGPIGLIAAGVAGIAAVAGSAISSVEEFNKSLKGLSAITGVEGRALDDVGDMALDMSQKFGTAATDIIDSMSKIGGQAPVLLQDMDALGKVTEAAIVLSKAADNMTVEDTAKAITTVMNQFGVSGAEATNIINTLAAGSKEGAAEVDYLTTAMEKAGTQASNAGMSYQQTIAAIETLAPKFSSAEVAGTGLSSMLIRLTTQANNDFNPAIVGLDKALENLDKANLSAAEKLKLFGAGSLTAADTLIKNREALVDMTKAVSDTNTAYDQMETKGGSLEQMWNQLKSAWDALMVNIGKSQPIQNLIIILGALMKAIQWVIQGLNLWMKCFNTVVDVIKALMVKLWTQGIKPYWDAIVNAITNNAIYRSVVKIWNGIKNAAFKAIKYVTDLWNKFMEWLGLSSKKADVKVPVDIDTETLDPSKIQSEVDNKTKKTKAKVKIDYDKGSLEDYRHQLQALQDKLVKKNLSLIDVEKTKADIEKIKKIIKQKEEELKLSPNISTKAGVDQAIKEIDDKLEHLDPNIDVVEITELKIKKDELEEKRKEIEAALKPVEIVGTKFKSEGKEGSLQHAQDKVSWYEQRIKVTTEEDPDYKILQENLKEWKRKEQVLKLKFEADTSNLKEGSLAFLNDKLSKLKSELQITAVGTPEYYEIIDDINKYTKEEQKIKLQVDLDTKGAKTGSLEEIGAHISDIEARMSLEVYGSDEYKKLASELKEWTKKDNKIRLQMEIDGMSTLERAQTIFDGFSAIDGIVSSVKTLNEAIEGDADAWTILMASIQTIESIIAGINTVMQVCNVLFGISTGIKASNAVASTAAGAAATEEAAEETATVAPKTAEVVANRALEASILDLAAAQIFLAHASIPFAGPAIAGGLVAGMMAAMAAQHAASMALQAFASGGVVKGSTTIGDGVLVRANKGEMVLNQRQQNNLFEAIDKNRLGTADSGLGQVEFVIKGDRLVGAIKNYEKIHKK